MFLFHFLEAEMNYLLLFQDGLPLLLRGRVHGEPLPDGLGRVLVEPLRQRGLLRRPHRGLQLHLFTGIQR